MLIFVQVKLLEALTSSREGVALGSERDDIYIEVSDHVEVLIELMKRHPEAKRSPEARLLAAKTVVNILVNQSVYIASSLSCHTSYVIQQISILATPADLKLSSSEQFQS